MPSPRAVKTVEIVYRYDADELRRRPGDARSARERLERGNVGFARLVDRVDTGDERPRAISTWRISTTCAASWTGCSRTC